MSEYSLSTDQIILIRKTLGKDLGVHEGWLIVGIDYALSFDSLLDVIEQEEAKI
jgi:hypothetical protein